MPDEEKPSRRARRLKKSGTEKGCAVSVDVCSASSSDAAPPPTSEGESPSSGTSPPSKSGSKALERARKSKNKDAKSPSSKSPSLFDSITGASKSLAGSLASSPSQEVKPQDESKLELAPVPRNMCRDGVEAMLSNNGLDAYADMFQEHNIVDENLPFLADEQLKEMGMTVLGDRMFMAKVIKAAQRSQRKLDRNKVLWQAEPIKHREGGPAYIAKCGCLEKQCGGDETSYTLKSSALIIKESKTDGMFQLPCIKNPSKVSALIAKHEAVPCGSPCLCPALPEPSLK